MKKMKITYLNGCNTCNDGLTDHINAVLESDSCETVTQAVREVTEMLNNEVGSEYFIEKSLRDKYMLNSKLS